MLLMKKGTDYYVVYSITYIKEKKNEHIFVLYYFLHKNLGADKQGMVSG